MVVKMKDAAEKWMDALQGYRHAKPYLVLKVTLEKTICQIGVVGSGKKLALVYNLAI